MSNKHNRKGDDEMADKKADLAGSGIGDYNELEKILPDDYEPILDRRETQIALLP